MLDAAQLELLIKDKGLIAKLYDSIVMINPVEKKIDGFLKSEFTLSRPMSHKCFNMWRKEKRCENCIASRALHEQRTTVKIEYVDEKIYMVTAVPLITDDKLQVVELIKDITADSLLEVDGTAYGSLQRIINRNNNAMVKDAFTRIYNSNYIYERLPEDLFYAREFSLKLALVFVTITNLKTINDHEGYGAGNSVIKTYAKLVKELTRKERDWSARFSGSDFILVLTDINENQTYSVCKRLNDKIFKTDFFHEGKKLKPLHHISFYCVDNEITNIDKLIHKARSKRLTFDAIGEEEKIELQKIISLDNYLLTERESKTAMLLLKGCSNSEIASTHFVSQSTVKKHIASIYSKTNVKSRAEFIALFKG